MYSGFGSRPVPDPTELTDRAIARLEKQLTLYIDGEIKAIEARLDAQDKAQSTREVSVEIIHEEIQRRVTQLQELHEQKFAAIQVQLGERDARVASEKKDAKLAVDAAFAAAKETGALQEKANREAIDKSERATSETIKTNQESSRAAIASLSKGLDEVKDRVTRIESAKVGGTENRTNFYATIGLIATVTFLFIAVFGFILARTPLPT
jgi:GTP1/Obg family GTP-binding protein